MEFDGFGKVKEWVFNLVKMIFVNGRREIMKIEEFYGEKGRKWRLILEEGEGENDGFSAVYSHEICRISDYKMGTAMKILDRGMRPSRVFKSQRFLVIKLCSLETQKVLATSCYNQIFIGG